MKKDPTAPEWFGLLRYSRERGDTGFTIPFLIGATDTAPRPQEAKEREPVLREAVTSLLRSFRDETPSTHWVVIADCHNKLHAPVAGVYPPGDRREGRIAVPDGSGITRLYADREYFHGKKHSIESLSNGLWKWVGEALLDGAFSRDGDRYGPFTAADQQLIDDARRWWASSVPPATGTSRLRGWPRGARRHQSGR